MTYNKNEFLKGSATYTALNYLYEAVKSGYVEDDPTTSDWETSKQMMADGKIGFMCLGTWAVGQMQAKSKTPQNVKFMPAPVRHNGKAVIQIGSDYGMGVNKYSKNIELAKAFVKFFVHEYPNDSNMISSVVGSKLPAYLSGAKNVTLVEAKPGTTKQANDFDNVQKTALLSIYDGTWLKTIVEIGLGSQSQTFDEYMADLNSKWVKGIESLGN
jgi:ABC-type glycerol-3-phosphate transport system substrate-binding protein